MSTEPRTPLPAAEVSAPSPADRLMVLAPHPDDETIGTGGMLAAACRIGASVRVLVATSGENNPWAQRAFERRLSLDARARIRFAGKREEEVLAALQTLGVARDAVVFFRLPDQGLTHLLLRDPAALGARLAEQLRQFSPTILLVPAGEDLHPDHSALAVASELALAQVRDQRLLPKTLAFVVHNPRLRRLTLPSLALAEDDLARKGDAVTCHASQLVLRSAFLRSFAAPAEPYSPQLVPTPGAPHPIAEVRRQADDLLVRLRPRFKARAWGPATLLLLPAGEATTGVTVHLPWWSRTSKLVDYASSSLVGRGLVRRLGREQLLRLPAHVAGDARVVYLKLERRFGFFDEAGWVKVTLDESREAGRGPS